MEQMRPLKSKISISIEQDVIEKIRILAEEDDRSVSSYINLLLREHIKSIEHDKK